MQAPFHIDYKTVMINNPTKTRYTPQLYTVILCYYSHTVHRKHVRITVYHTRSVSFITVGSTVIYGYARTGLPVYM